MLVLINLFGEAEVTEKDIIKSRPNYSAKHNTIIPFFVMFKELLQSATIVMPLTAQNYNIFKLR